MSIPLRAAVVATATAVTLAAAPPNAQAIHKADEQVLRLALAQGTARLRRAELVTGWERKARRAVRFAYRQIGKPYVWGGTGRRGYDCSGLVQRSWHHAGVAIPRVAAWQYHHIRTHVRRRNLRPGDLLYFLGLEHVGMYLGHGRFIHSPHTGTHVQVARLTGFWNRVLVGVARPAWPHLPRIPTHLRTRHRRVYDWSGRFRMGDGAGRRE